MRIGMVGLGRMGGNMTLRLMQGGHEVVGYARNPASVAKVQLEGAAGANSLEELVEKLDHPRVVWLMIPAGGATEVTIAQLAELLDEDDVVVDGGNSRYTDSVRRYEMLGSKGIGFVDAGTSGGIWGLTEGYCLMVGGQKKHVQLVEPAFQTLAPPNGYLHVGGPGAGHFVKMVHNGVEYALMQAYGEGFEILDSSDYEFDLPAIAGLWNNGSVVRSWLLELAAKALAADPRLTEVSDHVDDSGEGRWTVETAIQNAVPTPTIALSLFARFASRQESSFSGKMLAALRKEFGGHAVHKEEG